MEAISYKMVTYRAPKSGIRVTMPFFYPEEVLTDINEFYKLLAVSYIEGAQRNEGMCASICVTSGVWTENGIISVWYDVTAYKKDDTGENKLIVYRRHSQVWDADRGIMLPYPEAKKYLKNLEKTETDELDNKESERTEDQEKKKDKYTSKDRIARTQSDGFYINERKIVLYKNLFKPGSENGIRRSQYFSFIRCTVCG